MAPKRKSDAIESASLAEGSTSASTKSLVQTTLDRPTKKARASDASDVSSAPDTGKEASTSTKPQSWKDIKLEGEDEARLQAFPSKIIQADHSPFVVLHSQAEVPIYDDCGEVRRKIRLLQKTPGWKVTQWLRDIGGINSNSFGRFMREKGKTDGASNGTYYAAYVYFEKVRIFENKKKTPKRNEMEKQHKSGLSRENRRYMWVFNG